ncbi:MAG: sodium/proton-translocating pyrophosphatase, partial [Ginsengibacter sp.]
EYEKCVAISTDASIKKMMMPGAIALISPLIIGFVFGPEVLGGFLAGATVSGVLMGMFQNNAGGAWDNAKKSFEKGAVINNETYYKGSEPHKASVTGDTVGDPFKDTSGPSMNILIKLMSIISLVIAPTLARIHHTKIEQNRNLKMENLLMLQNETNVANGTNNRNVWTLQTRNPNNLNAAQKDIKRMIDEMEQDNLIGNSTYSVEVANSWLYINGVKQPADINSRYKKYYAKTGDFITGEAKK